MSLHVGLNALFWTERSGGAGRYVRELVPALLATEPGLRLTVFATRDRPRVEWEGGVEWVTAPYAAAGGAPWLAARRLASQWMSQPLRARRGRLDILHGLAGVAAPVAPAVRTLVTVLDLIWLRDRESMGTRDTWAMKASVLPSIRRARRVIAISEAVRSDVAETLRIPHERIDVTPLGVRVGAAGEAAPEAEARRALGAGAGPLVLCVAQKRSHKNLIALVRALPLLPEVELALVGAHTPHEDELRAAATQLGVGDRVHLPGWLGERELEGAYRAAAAFALPSFEEGFGLPVLEAMARGVPVACSTAPALAEVAGDAAALFDPYSPDAAAAAIGQLLADRESWAARGRERAAEFTWERTARATLDAYRRAIG